MEPQRSREEGDGPGLGGSVEHLQGLVQMKMCSDHEKSHLALKT